MELTPDSTSTHLDTLRTPTPPPPPPPPTQPTSTSKSLSFTNGSLRRHRPSPMPPPDPATVVSYKECLKNHAASIGGHALDGCGEFMPSSASDPGDPRSLKCAACGCHRNFHRREPQEFHSNPNFLSCFYPPQPPALAHRVLSQSTSPSLSPSPSSASPSPLSSPSPPPVSHFPPSYPTSAPHMLLALGNAYSGPSDGQHRSFVNSSAMKTQMENPSGKKRYRTKFSQEQKEKMYLFSEKLGWRMQKGDDRMVQDFCNEVGVSRGVFKVWMHNKKITSKKKSEIGNTHTEKINEGDDNGGSRGGFDSDINNDNHRNAGSCINLHVSANGSSS